jgi:hypothetical protein
LTYSFDDIDISSFKIESYLCEIGENSITETVGWSVEEGRFLLVKVSNSDKKNLKFFRNGLLSSKIRGLRK